MCQKSKRLAWFFPLFCEFFKAHGWKAPGSGADKLDPCLQEEASGHRSDDKARVEKVCGYRKAGGRGYRVLPGEECRNVEKDRRPIGLEIWLEDEELSPCQKQMRRKNYDTPENRGIFVNQQKMGPKPQ